jgi:hypothetical protein
MGHNSEDNRLPSHKRYYIRFREALYYQRCVEKMEGIKCAEGNFALEKISYVLKDPSCTYTVKPDDVCTLLKYSECLNLEMGGHACYASESCAQPREGNS